MARVPVPVQAGRCGAPPALEYSAPAATRLADVVRCARRSAARELVSSLSGEAAGERTHRNGVAGKESLPRQAAAVSACAVLRLHLFERRGIGQGLVVAASIVGAVLSGGSPQGALAAFLLRLFGRIGTFFLRPIDRSVFGSAFQVLQGPRIPKLKLLQEGVKGGGRAKSNAIQFNCRAVLGNRAQVDGGHRFADILAMLKIRGCLYVTQDQQLIGYVGDNRVLDVSGLPANGCCRVAGLDHAADTELDPGDGDRPAFPAVAAAQQF